MKRAPAGRYLNNNSGHSLLCRSDGAFDTIIYHAIHIPFLRNYTRKQRIASLPNDASFVFQSFFVNFKAILFFMTQIYTHLFSRKYVDTRSLHFSLLHIDGLHHKKQVLRNWRDSIRSGKIIKAKEEQLQADFLNTIFGQVLEYAYEGALQWNLQKEHKSGTDATKADGALGYFSMHNSSSATGALQADVRAVIELKDARTDLDKPQNRKNDKRTPVSQAFDYASKNIIEYVNKFRDSITCKEVELGKHPFYALHRERNEKIFLKEEKIIGVITGDKIITAMDTNKYYPTDGLYILAANKDYNNKFLVSYLNSRLATFFYRLLSLETGRTLAQVKPNILKDIPFIKISPEGQQPFIAAADIMLAKNKELQELKGKFMGLLQSDFAITKPSAKLQAWHELDWKSFEAELKKAKVLLRGEQKDDWFDRFARFKTQATTIQTIIIQTDRKIDRMVYGLYGLTSEEIAIVEGG